jgi:hypothetical protein
LPKESAVPIWRLVIVYFLPFLDAKVTDLSAWATEVRQKIPNKTPMKAIRFIRMRSVPLFSLAFRFSSHISGHGVYGQSGTEKQSRVESMDQ